jgi:calcineurin-like phosphoesterase family protein
MYNTFIVSDTHFGHEKTCTVFKREDGSPLRSFRDADEMNAEMIKRWNAVVRPHDKVYHLGDVVINKKFLYILPLLNGKKRLIRGNHDIFPTKTYLQYFDEIYGVRVLADMILSHIPLARDSITERFNVNVHGHLHANVIMSPENDKMPDYRYMNACVEHWDYTPVSLDTMRDAVKERQKLHNFTPGQAWGNGTGPG